MISRATKERWFQRGAAAFEHHFPKALEKWLGPGHAPAYVCPLCDPPRAFLREGLDSGELTAEHVPPESFGGR
jgi:hypothetical protein